MTTAEAIKRLENDWFHALGGQLCVDECKKEAFLEAVGMAISALSAQQEAEKNEPLTLEELREMDGEPVWLRIAGGVWGLVDTDDDVVWLDRGGSVGIRALSGKAYRRKPKEENT